jgi:hypothetical protein
MHSPILSVLTAPMSFESPTALPTGPRGYSASGAGEGGAGSSKADGSASEAASASGTGRELTTAGTRGAASSATSHSQQSLHFRHFSQR